MMQLAVSLRTCMKEDPYLGRRVPLSLVVLDEEADVRPLERVDRVREGYPLRLVFPRLLRHPLQRDHLKVSYEDAVYRGKEA
jgi:hypothetical protein